MEKINESSQEYLDYIRKKLDSLNKEAGIDPTNKDPNQSKYEPKLMDPFSAMGAAALKYMEEQRKRNRQIE